jgi:primosomal protein N' (replication factor Y)
LTFHKDRNTLMCHYCGFERLPAENCPKCQQTQVRFQGMGTEKLLAEVERKFPNYVVRRMDSDSMRRPGSHQQVLDDFRDGVIHILLGTQMIAKGLDFPNVTLVGVVNADVGLHHADFRAAERTFQLLAQVAGRTGRGPRGGQVLVQTFCPDHPSILLAAAHNFDAFARVELAQRQLHNYPPFQRMARILVRSRDQQAAAAHADALAGAFRTALGRVRQPESAVRLLGPAETPVFRLKGLYRFHFQLQSASSALLHQVLRNALPAVRTPKGVELTVDVDPYDML